MGSEKQRLRIIAKLKDTFIEATKQKKGIDKNLLVSELCMTQGVTKNKSFEYIQVLLDSNFIYEDLGQLWFVNPKSNKALTPEEISVLEADQFNSKLINKDILANDAALHEQAGVSE